MLKLKNKNYQNIKRLFIFPEGQMHQNQTVYFHLCTTLLLKQYLR